MSIYRQQAILSSPSISDNKVEVFHHKSSPLLDADPSIPPSQVPRFDPKYAPDVNPSAKSLELSTKQSEFISNTMRGLRQEESDKRATKRTKTDHLLCSDKAANACEHEMHSLSCSGFDIVDEMELHPSIGQIVATSGGLITVWNDAFLSIAKPTAPMSQVPLTIFDLVEPRSLHQLYGMLALALDEEVMVQQEASPDEGFGAPSHLSIILPTKKFRNTTANYEMTVVFMEHIVHRERGFLGWITAAPSSFPSSTSISGLVSVSSDDDSMPVCESGRRNRLPRGTILRLENSVLCQLLNE